MRLKDALIKDLKVMYTPESLPANLEDIDTIVVSSYDCGIVVDGQFPHIYFSTLYDAGLLDKVVIKALSMGEEVYIFNKQVLPELIALNKKEEAAAAARETKEEYRETVAEQVGRAMAGLPVKKIQ